LKSKASSLENDANKLKVEKDSLAAECTALKSQVADLATSLAAAKNDVDLNHPSVTALVDQRLKEQESQLQEVFILRENTLKMEITAFSTNSDAMQSKIASLEATLEEEKQKPANTVAEPVASPLVSSEELTALQDKVIELGEKLATAMLENEQLKNSDLRFSEDDFKQMVQEVFVNSQSSFLTADEVESVEDEAKRETMVQVTKLHLKRLKEVLRQISATLLG